MTTSDLLQRYLPHRDSNCHGKTSDEPTAFSGEPDPIMSTPNPSQSFDAKTKLLHDMLDSVVKDLADSQSESASEWEGTLWRSPLRPRSQSPAYSDISESFESPGRIEHCANDLLSTPISPTYTQFKGPDGWPLGVEVAMNDFHRGRLSTPVVQLKELPNPLNLRKQKQRTSRNGGDGNRECQETSSCKSVLIEQHGDCQCQEGGEGFEPLALEKQHQLDSTRLEPLACQQQSHPRPQQRSECEYRQKNVDLNLTKIQQRSSMEKDFNRVCVPFLSTRKYGDQSNSLGRTSSEPHPATAHGQLPIGLALENANLELSTFHIHYEQNDGFHTEIDDTCLINKNSAQTGLSDSPPASRETHDDAHQAQPRINAVADAFHVNLASSEILSAFYGFEVESIDSEIGGRDNIEENTLLGIAPLTFEDSKADADSDIVSWKSSGPLEDILEESEDLFPSPLMLDQRQPQHFSPEFTGIFDLQKSSPVGERPDSMISFQGSQRSEPSTLRPSPLRFPPTLELTSNPSSKTEFEPTEPSIHRLIDAKSSESIVSIATLAKLKNPANEKECLSAAVLAEMRRTAESQPHFQTEPDSQDDRSQANIHPLFRSRTPSRQSLQPRDIFNDPPLRFVFEDDDSEFYEAKEGDAFSHRLAMKPHLSYQTETQEADSFVTQISVKEDSSSQLGKMIEEDTEARYLCDDDDTKSHEAEHGGTITPSRSTLRSSNDTTLVSSLENETLSSSFLPSISSSTADCLSASAIDSPAGYNSWASFPQSREHGNSFSTRSSATNLPTSTVPTPNVPFQEKSPTLCGTILTPSPSFGQLAADTSNFRRTPMTPGSSFGSSTGDRSYRRSVSIPAMFARYHKSRYPSLPTAATTASILSLKESSKKRQSGEITNDPFTTTCATTTPFALNLKAPTKENLADIVTADVDRFNSPTKDSPGRFGLNRRSLSTSGRPKTNEGLERVLSTMIFNPHRSHLHKRRNSTSAPIDTTAEPDGGGPGHRRSLSIATPTVKQKWEIAPPPTPLGLRDDFSMRYRAEPLEANDHYSSRKDALQGMKQGLKKVFGRK